MPSICFTLVTYVFALIILKFIIHLALFSCIFSPILSRLLNRGGRLKVGFWTLLRNYTFKIIDFRLRYIRASSLTIHPYRK